MLLPARSQNLSPNKNQWRLFSLNLLDFPDAGGIVDYSLLLRGIPYLVGFLFLFFNLCVHSFIIQVVILSVPNLDVRVLQGPHF